MSSIPLVAIVDDDPSVRRAIVALLQATGYRTAAFASAEAYLSSPDCARSACLITDMQMPGLSGEDMLRALSDRGIAVPAIIVTARPDAACRPRATAASDRHVLTKPFDPAALIACVERVLAERRSTDRDP